MSHQNRGDEAQSFSGRERGYETSAESPYLLGLDFSLLIEVAGKRGYRIAEGDGSGGVSSLCQAPQC